MITRRSLLKRAAASAAAAFFSQFPALPAPVQGLDILAAPNGASIVLAPLIEAGGLSQAAPGATLKLWRATDELRASIVSGRTRLFTTPTHVPANLYNRGLPIRLLCILSMGHLSIVTGDETIKTFADLKGKPVLGFFRNDMPDLVFRAIARMEGLEPEKDMTMSYVQTPMEAAHLLAAGKAETAILSEPPATGAMMMAAQEGRHLRRAIDLQEVWLQHNNTQIPMAGIAVHASLVEECPELIGALKEGLPAAKNWIFANREEAGELASRTLGTKPQVFARSLDHFNIQVMSAKAMKNELKAFYQTLLDLSPDTLGGKLLGDEFYLDL